MKPGLKRPKAAPPRGARTMAGHGPRLRGGPEEAPRRGLAIGFLAPYSVPTRWAMHLQHATRVLPGGLRCSMLFSLGDFDQDPAQNYASLRTEVVEQAKAGHCRWLFF